MNVILISTDSTLFSIKSPSDTQARHIYYANKLNELYPGSTLTIICYTQLKQNLSPTSLNKLHLIPTNTRFRFCFVFDLFYILLRILVKNRPHIISSQNPCEEGLVASILCKIFKVPHLAQLHFDIFSEEWKRERRINKLFFYTGKLALKLSTQIRVVSESLKIKVGTNVKKTSSDIVIIPVPVIYHPISSLKKDYPRILFVGRLVAQKNLKLWLEVAAEIKSKIPQAQFTIAGEGPLKQELTLYAEKLNLKSNLHFAGAVNYNDLSSYYANADVFLLTSSYEGFGRVLIEAMLSQVPVVSTITSGPDQLITNGQNGFLCSHDKQELAEKTLQILNDTNLQSTFKQNGIQVAKQFSLEKITEKLVHAWNIKI